VLRITIHEGKNRQIRRMCDAVGLEVARLRRVSIGPIKLGMLQPGEWRELKPAEVGAIRSAVVNAPQPPVKKAPKAPERPDTRPVPKRGGRKPFAGQSAGPNHPKGRRRAP
jgi:23S rRNA pseudouridine2605 synthase